MARASRLQGPDIDLDLHVFTTGCSEIERMPRFRDWLGANATERDLYLRQKRALASRTWTYVQEYADAKSAVVEEILRHADAPPLNPTEREQTVGG